MSEKQTEREREGGREGEKETETERKQGGREGGREGGGVIIIRHNSVFVLMFSPHVPLHLLTRDR